MWSLMESCWELNPTEFNELLQGKRVQDCNSCQVENKVFNFSVCFSGTFPVDPISMDKTSMSLFVLSMEPFVECRMWILTHLIFTVVTLFWNTGLFYFRSIGFQTARNNQFCSEIFLFFFYLIYMHYVLCSSIHDFSPHLETNVIIVSFWE